MISIVVIGYNIEKYIIRCFDSIVKQTCNDYEVIFVDDGSIDNTLTLAKEFVKNNHLNNFYIYSKKNEGCIKARLNGLSHTHGEYITFIDGDDYIYENMISTMYKCIYQKKEYDIISWSYDFQINNNIVGYRFIDKYNNKVYDYSFLINILTNKTYHSIYPRLIKKEYINKFDFKKLPSISLAEDILILSYIALGNPKCLVYRDSLMRYCYNDTSLTKKNYTSRLNEYYIALEFIENEINNNLYIQNKNNLISYMWAIFLLQLFEYMYCKKTDLQVLINKSLSRINLKDLLKYNPNSVNIYKLAFFIKFYKILPFFLFKLLLYINILFRKVFQYNI